MAANEINKDQGSDQSCEKLEMITMTYINVNPVTGDLKESTVLLPRSLGCAVSSGIRVACRYLLDKSGSADISTICGGADEDILRDRIFTPRSTIEEGMECFTRWLYSRQIIVTPTSPSLIELWHLGQMTGTPKFQNDIVRRMATMLVADPQSLVNEADIKRWWVDAIFLEGEYASIVVAGRVCDNHHKLLRFLLNVLVYRGPMDPTVKAVISTGGDLAVALSSLMVSVAESQPRRLAPWSPENIGEYLIT